MDSSSSSCLFLFLFLSFLSLAFAVDMSILDYKHVPQESLREDNHLRTMYELWLVKHGKAYNALGMNDEKERRFEIFKDNLRFIEEHNALNDRPFKLGLTQFADLTNDEYRAMYLGARVDRSASAGLKLASSKRSDRYAFQAGDGLPQTVDWRTKGAVGPVKDQGQCGTFLFFPVLFFSKHIN